MSIMKNISKKEFIEAIFASEKINLLYGGIQKKNVAKNQEYYTEILDNAKIYKENDRKFSEMTKTRIYFSNGSCLDFAQQADEKKYYRYKDFYIMQYSHNNFKELVYTTIIYKIY